MDSGFNSELVQTKSKVLKRFRALHISMVLHVQMINFEDCNCA
jgi:hypothetical protein